MINSGALGWKLLAWGRFASVVLMLWGIASCVAPPPSEIANKGKSAQLQKEVAPIPAVAPIPDLAKSTPFLMPEDNAPPLATFTVNVTDAPVREVLFALARDADLNLDIYPGITGNITMNAVDQTLPTILNRIAEQSDLTYQIDSSRIVISLDKPFRRNYRVNYIQNSRVMDSRMTISTNVDSSANVDASQIKGNSSQIKLDTKTDVEFWKNLKENIDGIIGQPKDKDSQAVIWNRTTGIINVLGTERQHQEVQRFLDQVMRSALRQVFIEATIIEIQLADKFQAGVDWSLLNKSGGVLVVDPNNAQSMLGRRVVGAPSLALEINHTKVPFLNGILNNHDLTATVRMLAQFGDTKVLSTPRITVLNNQTAVLRVTTNQVYFQIVVTPGQTTTVGGTISTTNSREETEIKTVPIGLILQVTPQISDDNVVTLNIRPTIQRISEWVDNPDPKLRTANVNFVPPQVPVVQVQEMDSMLRVTSGQVAVMGGLMENSFTKSMDGVPILAKIPVFGQLFSLRSKEAKKKELVIFLRPIILNDFGDVLKADNQNLYNSRHESIPASWNQLGLDTP